jgi:hypothetical protein
MEILATRHRAWLPISITMALGHKRALLLGEGGRVRVDEREYRWQLRFLSTRVRNIKQQQGL